MKFIDKKIKLSELKEIAENMFGDLVKVVVDVEKKVMVAGGELHSDEENFLIEKGCQYQNLWGINIYPEKKGENFVEFDSLINLKPSLGNKSRFVEDEKIRKKIFNILEELIEDDLS